MVFVQPIILLLSQGSLYLERGKQKETVECVL